MCSPKTQKLCGKSKKECKTCYNRSFATHEKSQYWNKYKNGDMTPRNVFRSSGSKFWFMCDNIKCQHDFEMPLRDISGDHWCCYCGKKELCNDKNCTACYNNSFASHNKAKHWHATKNGDIKPRNLFKNTHDKFWLKCAECHHDFEMSLNSISSGCWCPHCHNKTERKLKEWLEKTYPKCKIKTQFKFDKCRSEKTNKYLPFDFLLENIIIELDGIQHFTQVSNWETPEDQLIRDVYKMNKARESGYHVIRIFQEDVLNNRQKWKSRLKRSIKLLSNPELLPSVIYVPGSQSYETMNKVYFETP